MHLQYQLFCVISLWSVLSFSQSFYFKSGFENDIFINQFELNGVENSNYADLYGMDLNSGYDWVNDLDDNYSVGNFRIYYENGDTSAAKASIENDPLNNTNKVLKFQLNAPNVTNSGTSKGRIQAALNNNENLKEFSFSVKLYLHPDINVLKSSDEVIHWFTIMEFWNNESFKPFPFRITLNIQKPDSSAGSNLYFGTHGQIKDDIDSTWTNVWKSIDTNFEVPTGEWLTFNTYVREGDSIHGRYKVTVKDTLNEEHILFDINNYTHHPLDVTPDGIKSFNPMKLYTSSQLIEGMNAAQAELSVFWDDFEIRIEEPTIRTTPPLKNSFKVLYPNPVSSHLNLACKSCDGLAYAIYNSKGILKQKGILSNSSINCSNLSKGAYLIRVDKKNTNELIRFIKL